MLYYLLRGDNEELAQAELRALLETYGVGAGVLRCLTSLCLVEHNVTIVDKVVSRAGFLKEAGLVIGLDNVDDRGFSFTDRVEGVGRIYFRVLKNTCRENDVRNYVEELRAKVGGGGASLMVYCSENVVFVTKPLVKQPTSELFSRRPSRRPFFRSIALMPHVARLLVNLARVRENDTLLDPFAGTGSILVEAGFMGIKGFGVEIDSELARGMKINVDNYRLVNQIVVHGDSLDVVFNSFDAIATDPPYGRSASLHGVDVKHLYGCFLDLSRSFVKKRGFIVFLSDSRIEDYVDEALCRLGFLIYDKHYMFIHGGLTRVVYEVVNN